MICIIRKEKIIAIGLGLTAKNILDMEAVKMGVAAKDIPEIPIHPRAEPEAGEIAGYVRMLKGRGGDADELLKKVQEKLSSEYGGKEAKKYVNKIKEYL